MMEFSSACVSIILAILILILVALLFKFIRPKFGVAVVCWFCGESTKVPYGNSNCWDCPSCEQYNGFNKDGGYNKEIPSQFSEHLNHDVSCSRDEFLSSNSTLCSRCTTNQQLKIKQLANYLPYREDNYDKEIEAYKEHLEYDYQLCDSCTDVVQREIQRQDDILLKNLEDFRDGQYNKTAEDLAGMDLNKTENIFSSFLFSKPILSLMKILSIIISSILVMNYTRHLLDDGFVKLSAFEIVLLPFRTLLPLRSDHCFLIIMFGLVINMVPIVKLPDGKRRTSTDILSFSFWCLQLLCHFLLDFSLSSQRFMGALISWTTLLLSCLAFGSNSKLPKVTLRRYSLANSRNDTKTSSAEMDGSESKSISEPVTDFIEINCRDNAVGLINTNLNSISLGPITPRTNSPAPCFSPVYTQLPPTAAATHRQALIHPARFTIVQQKSEKKGSNLRKRLLSDWDNESNITASSQSSICLVGSTTDNANANPHHGSRKRLSFTDDDSSSSRSGMMPISPKTGGSPFWRKPEWIFGALLAGSVFLNTILVTYLLTKMYG